MGLSRASKMFAAMPVKMYQSASRMIRKAATAYSVNHKKKQEKLNRGNPRVDIEIGW
jgi:hypothetical protein